MRVVILTDMEGASGVIGWEQTRRDEMWYQEGRRFLTHDVNAAVEGALAGGATKVVVTDTHALMPNILFEELHPEADLVWGSRASFRPHLVLQGVDKSGPYDLVLLIGLHAAASQGDGILSHSYHGPSDFFELKINGMSVGEHEIATALAGAYGLACGMITGDDVTAEYYKKIQPDAEAVIVKYAYDRGNAYCLSLAKTKKLISDAAKRAVERGARGEFEPWCFESPFTLEVTVTEASMANACASIPNAKRVSQRVVSYTTDSYFDLYETMQVFEGMVDSVKFR
jgi:D-amino peptidase